MYRRFVKRGLDIVISMLALALFDTVMHVIAAFVDCSDLLPVSKLAMNV